MLVRANHLGTLLGSNSGSSENSDFRFLLVQAISRCSSTGQSNCLLSSRLGVRVSPARPKEESSHSAALFASTLDKYLRYSHLVTIMLHIRPDLQAVLKDRWEPPKVYENILDQNDIDFLLDKEINNPNKKTLPYRVFGLDTAACQEYLRPKLQEILKHPYKITGGNFFRTEVPYRLHADTGIDENCALYRIVVFPLYFDTGPDPLIEEFNCLTIMDQRWYNQAAFFMKGEEEKFEARKEYNSPVGDYSPAMNLSNVPFPVDRFNHMYDHLVYKNFEGMSELFTAEWRVGNAITFDRSHIHTTTNFFKSNVKLKVGLTFFTEYADL